MAVVAIGLVLSNVCSAAFGMLFVRRRVGRLGFSEVAFSWVRMVAACMVASALAYLVTTPLRDGQSGRMWAFAELTVGGLVFAVVYFGLALLMRVPEVGEMLAPVVRRLPGGRPRGGTHAVDGTIWVSQGKQALTWRRRRRRPEWDGSTGRWPS